MINMANRIIIANNLNMCSNPLNLIICLTNTKDNTKKAINIFKMNKRHHITVIHMVKTRHTKNKNGILKNTIKATRK